MKTWEIIKLLSENPNLKFKTNNDFSQIIYVKDDTLCWEGTGNPFELNVEGFCTSGTVEKYEWEAYSPPDQEVDFMTALEAKEKGKRVYFKERDGYKRYPGAAVCWEDIKKSWFIKNE